MHFKKKTLLMLTFKGTSITRFESEGSMVINSVSTLTKICLALIRIVMIMREKSCKLSMITPFNIISVFFFYEGLVKSIVILPDNFLV